MIVQDFGAFAFLKREFPNLDLHASTQMSVHSVQSAALTGKTGSIQSCSGKRDQPGGDRSDPAELLLWKSNVLCTGHFVTVIPVSV